MCVVIGYCTFATQFTLNPWEPGQPFDPLGPLVRKRGLLHTAETGLSLLHGTFGQNPGWHVVLCSSSLLSLSVDVNELTIEILRLFAFYMLANSMQLWKTLHKLTCKCFDLSSLHNQKKTVFKESDHLIFTV